MIALGVMGLRSGAFTPIWTGVPPGMPARSVLAYAYAGLSLGCGIGLLWARTAPVEAACCWERWWCGCWRFACP
ncbi:MAG: hypothetical protein U0163_16880 [Gemmatimonadaceae bacterium]